MDEFQTIFIFLVGLLVALLLITALVALVYILTGLLNSTRRAERAVQAEMRQVMGNIPRESQEAFVSYTNRHTKSPTIAVLLALLLGWLGAHRFYLRDYGIGFMYLAYTLIGIPISAAAIYLFYNPALLPGLPNGLAYLLAFFVWLGIPALVAFFESFWMPRRAYERNLQVLREAQGVFAVPMAVAQNGPVPTAQLSSA